MALSFWHLLLLILCAMLSMFSFIAHSLQLKMIHRDSIHSPLYPGNLTDDQRLQRLIDHDEAREQFYNAAQLRSNFSEERVRPRVHLAPYTYLVELTLGEPPNRKTYFLVMDSGSNTMWMQCEPCKSCWAQSPAIFNPSRDSHSFRPLPCNHHLCDLSVPGWKCISNVCHYSIYYVHPAWTNGFLATDTISFASSIAGRTEYVPDIGFGCSGDNHGFTVPTNVAGILGLDMSRTSLASQLGSRFSYCLRLSTNAHQPPGRLMLGVDAILIGPGVKHVPFVNVHNSYHYYLPLVDVSVAGHRIGFAPGTFHVHYDHGLPMGGFNIDSGSYFSTFAPGPYERIMDAFKDYFRSIGMDRPTPWGVLEMCYPSGRSVKYPSMTLHFENGIDLLLQPENVITHASGVFCVGVRPSSVSLLGAWQHVNYKFSYDIQGKRLYFFKKDCNQDL